jgi:F0F1-type ATP synthase epsilon subunit
MFDIKKAKEEAEKELAIEKGEKAKKRIKEKLSQMDAAKKVVQNIERELEDLYVELGQSL